MKVLLVSMYYDYGDEKKGTSLDFYYFEDPLKRMGIEVITFDFMSTIHLKGKVRMNQDLLESVEQNNPDLIFVVPFTDQFIPEVLDKIKQTTTSLVYYFDDVWRIDYSMFWSRHFTYATTSDINGLKRWSELGCNNFIYSPFGCNIHYYKDHNLPKIYDVSFVGGYHPYRAWVFKRLDKAGIKVNTFGYGWPAGKISLDNMIRVFNESKINLNLSNNESWDIRYIFSLSSGLKNTFRVIRQTCKSLIQKDAKTREMVKARHFEINACGGFQLSYYTQGLEKHFQIGDEIAIFESVEDLIDKIHYYLKHDEERVIIARNGYSRTKKDHSMVRRFSELFKNIGFKAQIND